MTETKALDSNGEALEQVSSNQDEKSPDKTRGATGEFSRYYSSSCDYC